MPKSSKSRTGLPEAFVSSSAISELVGREVRAGRMRKLASRLYTTNLCDTPEEIVRRNLWQLVGQFFPGALIADRTAIELKLAPDGSVFVVSPHKRAISIPGAIVRPRLGHGPLESDRQFINDLFLSSPARAYLDNLRASRVRGGRSRRTLARKELEQKLEELLSQQGESVLNKLRDQAKEVAQRLGLERERSELDKIIGALLGTKTAQLGSKQAKARKAGLPYDTARLPLFEHLLIALREYPAKPRMAKPIGRDQALPFYEAYFSNFIEGTEFEIEEAEDIIFKGKVPANRPADAHDIRGTFSIVASQQEMAKTPGSYDEFESLLTTRHAVIMGGRPATAPGEFKSQKNRAGSTLFVAPELVRGTLAQGFGYYRSLESPFARAIFMMFLVSEVHPFSDGNGRTARIFMNAELVHAGHTRILIPTVYHAEYLSALKALSHNKRAQALIRVLDYAQRYTHEIDWRSLSSARTMLTRTNAFMDSADAERDGIHLDLPETDE